MKYTKFLIIAITSLFLTACADWIYRIDIPQGNFLEQKDVDKLRINMTKEQVIFVLGRPVVEDAFDKDTWYYVYKMKRGMKKRGEDFTKELIVNFNEDNRVASVTGDFELADTFNTPLDE
ncbi:outer membrane protein assembly factor BamE [Aestuariibacter sp. AA17]|uniref:Outer membrane protein assembly factor BamE n=1 Tax=Fluctibacter corallii TaxID=2984329 RepID=A0ABT3ABB6_9ALTE|nr:outer membrane protein assembly factor BamE [Aestuariibacter sp. AA17]MCV2885974.1 outer membrane protein assembly factor BamE [Aestuariibacter sp. AA17]